MFSFKTTFFTHSQVQIADLPNIPPSVELAQLDENFNFIKASEYTLLQQKSLADGRYYKHKETSQYEVGTFSRYF